MKVLSVSSEAVPLAKTGGLADVVGALPQAMDGLGVDMRVLLPAYRSIRAKIAGEPVWASDNLFGGPASIHVYEHESAVFLLLDAPHLYDRDGALYGDGEGDFADNPQRFAALSWAAAEIARVGLIDKWRPDLVHAHDWQAGFVPAYLKFAGISVPSLITVHNIAFQGIARPELLDELKLPAPEFNADGLEYYGQLSALKAGLVYADAISTVSPTYASELTTSHFGMGMEGVIRHRVSSMHGILNGIDTAVWDPSTGGGFMPFSATKLAGKGKNRKALMAEFGLHANDGPLAIVVSRLSDQKGIDLLLETLPPYFAAGGALCLLGSGDAQLEHALMQLAAEYPDQFGLRIGYDEALAMRMFAGADSVLVPSRFEPCGLTQMYGLRFGTLPVVAATGGLADTVIHANEVAIASGSATGITFARIDAAGLSHALSQLIKVYRDKKLWKTMQKNAMKQSLGWENSAKKYVEIYEGLLA